MIGGKKKIAICSCMKVWVHKLFIMIPPLLQIKDKCRFHNNLYVSKSSPYTSPGSKAMDYSNGLFDCQSPTSPFLGGLRVLHLLEDLRAALELMDNDERDNLRCQIPDSTAEGLAEWLHGRMVKRPRVGFSRDFFVWSFRLKCDRKVSWISNEDVSLHTSGPPSVWLLFLDH